MVKISELTEDQLEEQLKKYSNICTKLLEEKKKREAYKEEKIKDEASKQVSVTQLIKIHKDQLK